MKTIITVTAALLLMVGCETTGNKRVNGSNTNHVNADLSNVTVKGNLYIGGEKQTSDGASQEGLGKVKAQASAQDSLNGNAVSPNALRPSGTLQDSFRTIPSKVNVPPVE